MRRTCHLTLVVDNTRPARTAAPARLIAEDDPADGDMLALCRAVLDRPPAS